MPSAKNQVLREKQAAIREAKRKAMFEASLSPLQKKIMSSKLTGWDQFVWGFPTFITASIISAAIVMLNGMVGNNVALNGIILIAMFVVGMFSTVWVAVSFTSDQITFLQRLLLHLLPVALGILTVLFVTAVININHNDILLRCAFTTVPSLAAAVYAMRFRGPKRFGVTRKD